MVKAESHVIVYIYQEARSGHSPLLGGLQILFIAHLYEAAAEPLQLPTCPTNKSALK